MLGEGLSLISSSSGGSLPKQRQLRTRFWGFWGSLPTSCFSFPTHFYRSLLAPIGSGHPFYSNHCAPFQLHSVIPQLIVLQRLVTHKHIWMINSWALLRPQQKMPNPKAPSDSPLPHHCSQNIVVFLAAPGLLQPARLALEGRFQLQSSVKAGGKGWEKIKIQRGRSSIWRVSHILRWKPSHPHLIPLNLLGSKGDNPNRQGWVTHGDPPAAFGSTRRI